MEMIRDRLRLLPAFLDDLFFPDHVRCLSCTRALDEDETDRLCPDCVAALQSLMARQETLAREGFDPLPPGVDYVSAAYPYEDQARTLIRRLKYRGVRAAAIPLARAMAMLPGGEEEVLVPVPTTKKRLRERGFNQAELLAEKIARELGMPMACALTRKDERAAQATLSARRRRQNLVGSMCADERVRGKRVLLVDDVYTTGSTAEEAARALLEAGARGVGVFVAAKTVPPRAQKGLFGREKRVFF